MSDSPTIPTPRPVSAVTILAILGSFGLFLLVAYYGYAISQPPAPQAVAPEKLPEELAWKATHATKVAALAELRANAQKQTTSYAWLDQKKGVVQLPLNRAIELFVQENGSRK
jgi:hypothetical protein